MRQLSLQQSQQGRRTLRKQSSEDGLGLRVLGEAPSVVRPRPPARPVRLAWSERRQLSCEDTGSSPPAVGVVVQRVRGLPRPVTAKPARATAPPPSILYSRQQLAERLRLAWRDRQQRPNLDIFLAHNSSDKLDEDPLLSVREIITEVEKNSLQAPEDSPKSKYFLSDILDTPSDPLVEDEVVEGKRFDVQSLPVETFSLESCRECTDSGEETAVDDCTNTKLTPSIKISFDHVDNREGESGGLFRQESVDLRLLSPDSCSHLEDYQKTCVEEEESEDRYVKIKEPDKPKQDNITATMRRANFRNSNNNPVMSGSMGSVLPLPPTTPLAKPILKKPTTQPLTRMMSAPATGRSAPSRGDLRVIERVESDDDMAIVQRERNIKSAPARRRFKNIRRKGPKSYEDDSSEGETLEEAPTALPAKARVRKRVVERTADIVTMVSLLSPTESEVEETPPVIQLPQDTDKLPAAEAEAKPVSTTATTTTSTASAASSIVCLRKFATKTGKLSCAH